MIWLHSTTSLFLTTPGPEVFPWPYSHKGTRKYNATICLYMVLELKNWDICQTALTTTTIKLRTNQPRCLFPTNMHNPAEILSYWVEVLIIKIPKVAPHPFPWLAWHWREQPSTAFHTHGSSLQIWLTIAFTFNFLSRGLSSQEQVKTLWPSLCQTWDPTASSLSLPLIQFCHAGYSL